MIKLLTLLLFIFLIGCSDDASVTESGVRSPQDDIETDIDLAVYNANQKVIEITRQPMTNFDYTYELKDLEEFNRYFECDDSGDVPHVVYSSHHFYSPRYGQDMTRNTMILAGIYNCVNGFIRNTETVIYQGRHNMPKNLGYNDLTVLLSHMNTKENIEGNTDYKHRVFSTVHGPENGF